MPVPSFQGVPTLVTGGAGFIGSHLVDALLARGATVRVLDDLSTGSLDNLAHCAAEIELVEGDIRDLGTCRRVTAACRFVFHQAAMGSVPRSLDDPASSLEVNAQGTVNVLVAARDAGVEHLVFASSSSVYGDSEHSPKREGEEGRILSPYAASKRINEELAQVFADCFGLRSVGLRYFNVYGPKQSPDGPYAAVVPRFFKAALEGTPMIIYGDGKQSRDFTYVEDAVYANLLAAGAGEAADGRAFNVATGRSTSVAELAGTIRELCRSSAEPIHDAPRVGDVRHSLADLRLAKATLGYEPKTSLEQGLAACLAHYRGLDRRP